MNQFEKALQKDILTYLGYLEEYNKYTKEIVKRIVEEHQVSQLEDYKFSDEQNFEYKRMRIVTGKETCCQRNF